MTIPNGQRGLRSDHGWLLAENKSLREILAREREEKRLLAQEFRALEDRYHMERELRK